MFDAVAEFSSRHGFVVGVATEDHALRVLGATPEPASVDVIVPSGGSWWVQPLDGLSPAAAHDVRQHAVPGLWLDPGRDVDLTRAAEFEGLEWLKVYEAFPEVSDAGLRALGRGACQRLRGLELQGEVRAVRVTAEGLRALEPLGLERFYGNWLFDDQVTALTESAPGLTTLDLAFSPITDAALDAVVRLEGLEVLDLSECELLTDPGVAQLASLPALRVLDLEGCRQVKDGGVAALTSLSALESLRLPHTVTDDALQALLPELGSLVRLGLGGCAGVSDASLALLADSGVTWLELGGTGVTDRGVGQLEGLGLTRLVLRGTQVSDASLHVLATLEGLEELDLTDTSVSREGATRLSELLPGCRLIWTSD